MGLIPNSNRSSRIDPQTLIQSLTSQGEPGKGKGRGQSPAPWAAGKGPKARWETSVSIQGQGEQNSQDLATQVSTAQKTAQYMFWEKGDSH